MIYRKEEDTHEFQDINWTIKSLCSGSGLQNSPLKDATTTYQIIYTRNGAPT